MSSVILARKKYYWNGYPMQSLRNHDGPLEMSNEGWFKNEKF